MLEHLMILVLLYCIYFCHLLFTHLFVAFSDTFTFVVYLFFFFSSRRRHTRSEEHRSELQSLRHLVCRLLLEKKKPIEEVDEQHVSSRGEFSNIRHDDVKLIQELNTCMATCTKLT